MKVWMGAWAVAGVLLLPMPQGIAATASPGSLAAVRQQVESSMLISGDVHIEADGSVSALMLHNEAKLPEGVVKLVRGNALQWRFEPIVMDGKAVRVVAPMSLRVVARQLEGGSYEIALRGVNFQKYDATDAQSVAIIQMNPPRYPERAYKSGASGSVYLLVKVGRNGKVEDAFAEQVNLTFLSRESDQRRFRELLARNAVVAAKGWTFRVPSEGDAAAQPYWNLRVPVSYTLSDTLADRGAESYGRWTSYVAGPRERAPWRTEEQGMEASPDSFADGGIYMADRNAGPRLLTPLQGG